MKENANFSTLVDLLRYRAKHQPDRRAYTLLGEGKCEEVSLTYSQLDQQARSIGASLHNLNAANERVVLLYPTSLEYLTAFFGCLYAGAIPIPAFPPRTNRPTPRIEATAADAQASIALTTQSFLPKLQSSFEHIPQLKELRYLGISYPEPIGDAENWEQPHLTGDSLAYIQYTSGSTISPRGVKLSHNNLLHNLVQLQEAFKIDQEGIGVSWLPLYHDMGLIGGVLLAMYVGVPLALMTPTAFAQQPLSWLQAIARYKGTVSGGPNFAYQLCVDRTTPEERASLDLSSWEIAFCAAEPIRADTLKQFAKAYAPCGFRPESFWPAYGLAEAALMVSAKTTHAEPIICTVQRSALECGRVIETDHHDESGQTFVSCGKVSPDQQVAIVDPESLARCPAGYIGEIWVSGPSIAQGYWQQPEESNQTFQAYIAETGEGPFLRTGDLGFMKDSELFVTGRLKELIIIRGLNYYPQDIEFAAQQSHPALQPDGSAAFSILIAGEEQLVIVHEMKRTYREADIEKVAQAIRRAVADQQDLPVYAVVLTKLGAIPRTSSGKIQRNLCRNQFLSGQCEIMGVSLLEKSIHTEPHKHSRSFVAPRTPIEVALTSIWADVLSLERIGILDNFFELGGHSLTATQVVSRIRETFQVELAVRSLFETPTIVGLAEAIEEALRQEGLFQVPQLEPADWRGPLPLSFAQERMWFLHQFDPESSAYNIPVALHLIGPLDRQALEQTIYELADRHEALRTTFGTLDGQPFQVIAPFAKLPINMVDLSDSPKPERKSKAIHLMQKEAQHSFNLNIGPLMRISLLKLDSEEHILILNMHHIVSDAWSFALLAKEIPKLYNAYSSGESIRLPKPPVQYVDFAIWQRQWLQDKELETHMAYWRKQLVDVPVLELPTDHPQPIVQAHHGKIKSAEIPESLLEKLKRLSHQEGVTLFMTLLAAFKVLLYRYTGQTDISVSTPIANRNRLVIEGMVGCFTNNIIMRTDLSGQLTFVELLQRVREVALEAYAHQDLPYAKLVAELQPERNTSHTPLAQVMFDLNNVSTPPILLKGLKTTPLEIDRQGAQFDLSLTVIDTEIMQRLSIEYSTDLFEDETIARILKHYVTLLEAILTNPDQHISHLPMLTDAEYQQLIVTWNDTVARYPQNACVHHLFESRAQQQPDAIALTCEGRNLTYSQLNQQANQLAHHLKELGVGPETLVGIYLERSFDMVLGLLGILKAGGAYLPLEPGYPHERLAFMLKDAQIRILLSLERLVTELPVEGIQTVCLDSGWQTIAQNPEVNPDSDVTPENLAYVIYTSGSTGKPKGVMIPHYTVVNFLYSMLREPGLTKQDVLLSVTSISFDIAVLEVFLPLVVGAQLDLVSRESAADGPRLLEKLASTHATVMQATPATWRLLLESGWSGNPHLKILCGGETLSSDLAEQLLERCSSLWNMYGPTETTVWSTLCKMERNNPISIGRPINNSQIYILDDHLQPMPIGVQGNLYIGGLGLARGYLNRPELTVENFIPHPFSSKSGERLYRTGDMARYLPDGKIEFLGRRDQLVKIRGFRIELGEIEAILSQHPSIKQSVVIAVENRSDTFSLRHDADKRLVAYLVSSEDIVPSPGELRSFLKNKLPGYMIPSAFVLLPALPLTPNNKVNRRILAELDQANQIHILNGGFTAPRNTVERQLINIWEEVLNRKPLGVQDNFFDLGGHSLLAVHLFARIESDLGMRLPLYTLFQSPTVEQLAKVICQNGSSPDHSTLVPIQPEGSNSPFFCVHGFGGGVLGYAELASLLGKDQPFYGLQAKGLDGHEEPHLSIENMAADYVQAIRSVQPAGPYYLGGYCYGGVVAFEMSRQLYEQGQQVNLLAIFEGYAPARSAAHDEIWQPQTILSFLGNLPYWLKGKLLDSRTLLRHRDTAKTVWEQAVRKWNIFSAQTVLPDDLDDRVSVSEKQRNVIEAHLQAMRNYHPKIYQGQITLFRVRALSLRRSYDPKMGWGKLTTNGVKVKMLPGAHYNILEKPHVTVLAEQLKASLTEVR